MHDHFPYKDEFSIDPGETQFVDVAEKGIVIGNVIQICHIIAHEKMSFVEVKTHDLKINVTGQDALPASINLRIEVTDQGLLIAKIIDP
jgi:hypothetical protein